ncbi:MAG TPA: tetratricopeptide repeat protein [Pyrinomonadaceae bacterium]|nr:tetratricopeptide repeat protein [Pyrinomonadaceae bacterium]
MIGQTVSRYKVIEKLGEGGMGVVYRAEDVTLGRSVAIKFLTSLDRHYRARFLREARAVSALTHPNIAAVYEYGETEEGQPYIVMELVKGQTLGQMLDGDGLTLAQSVEITAAIAEALGEAHRHGIVHRDVKPSNIVVTERGQVKVLDFGLVKELHEPISQTGDPHAATLFATHTRSDVIVGTPLYLSPEQATGKPVDGRSDLFALGAVLYECITGRSAFSGSSVIEIGAQVLHVDPATPSSINPRVPRALDRTTMKALEKDVDSRYQSAEEMLTDLCKIMGNLSSDGGRTQRLWGGGGASRPMRASALTTLTDTFRRPRLSVGTFVIAIVASSLAIWAILHWWKPAPYKPPAQAQSWYDRGSDALRNGAFLQASTMLQEALKIDDNFALGHARLAEALMELDYTDRAKDEALKVSALVPDRSLLPKYDSLYLDAVTATVTRDFPAAVKSFDELARLRPGDARVYVDLGSAYEKDDQTAKAVENYVKASTIDPQYATAYLRAGVVYSRRQEVASAGAAFDKAETLFKALGNTEGVSEVFRQRGVLFRNAGRFADARAQFQQSLKSGRAIGNDIQQVRALFELSNLSFLEGATGNAQEFAREGIEFAQQHRLENYATAGLIDLGIGLLGSGDYAEAQKNFKLALDSARLNKARRLEAIALMDLGSTYIQQLRTDEGLPLAQEALNYFRQGNYRGLVSECLTIIGRANRRKGEYDFARQALEEELQVSKEGHDEPHMAFAEAEIGTVYLEQEKYPLALQQYDESYQINKGLGRQLSQAYNQQNRGKALTRLGRFDEARQALQEATAIASEKGYKQLLPDIELSQAQLLLAERSLPQARAAAEKAIAGAGSQYKEVTAEAKSTLGLAQALSGVARQGQASSEEGLKIAQELGDAALISRAMLALAEATLEMGDAQSSLRIGEQAAERFANAGQFESEWRAFLICARANEWIGNTAAAQERKARAKEVLAQLEKAWGPDAYKRYLARPDIQLYYEQLGR